MLVKDKLKGAIEQRDKTIEELKHLMFFSNMMNDEVREENLINHLFMILKERFRPDILAVFFIDKEKHVINTAPCFPTGTCAPSSKTKVLLDPTLCRVIRTGTGVLCKRYQGRSRTVNAFSHPIKQGGCACYPLLAGGMVIGAILIAKKTWYILMEKTLTGSCPRMPGLPRQPCTAYGLWRWQGTRP